MTNRPWMPLYVADYLADTTHLRAIDSGGYLHLIMHYWQHGSLPNDDRKLAAIAKMTAGEWRRNRSTLAEFFSPEWRHKRIDAELAKAADISSKRAASAKLKHSNSSANAEQLDTHARASSLSPSQSEREDTADAVPSSGSRFAFESGVIRLTQKDFDQWKQAFSHLDLAAELLSLTEWAQAQPKWFHAVSSALAKRNRELKAAHNKKSEGRSFNDEYWAGKTPGIM